MGSRGHALKEDALGDALVGVLGVEVDRGLELVPEAVDVRGVGVDVRAKRVAVLEEQAQGLEVVRRIDDGLAEREAPRVDAEGAAHPLEDLTGRLAPIPSRLPRVDHPRSST